jgi:hypothetical protein
VGPTWQRREREETSLTDCANSKKRHLLANTPRLLMPSGLSVRTAACGAKWARAGPESEEKIVPNKIQIFEYTKALEICTRRFRRNFNMRNFPKFF